MLGFSSYIEGVPPIPADFLQRVIVFHNLDVNSYLTFPRGATPHAIIF